MRLWHFTHRGHAARIIEQGRILPSESNIGSPIPDLPPYGTGYGPDVVWLIDTPEPEYPDVDGRALGQGLSVEKRVIRFEVDVPAIKWTQWGPADHMHPEWRDIFTRVAGGPEVAERWYVWPSAIRRPRWRAVHDVERDEPIPFEA